MSTPSTPIHVSLVVTPHTQVGPLSGLYEALNSFEMLASLQPEMPPHPFDVELVAPDAAESVPAGALSVRPLRRCSEVAETDVVVVPLMMVEDSEWRRGRYPDVVAWLSERHRRGSLLCSTCTGVLLLAETGVLVGREATIHWAFAPTFRRNFPDVRLRPREALIETGDRHELVMTGGVLSWQDLASYLMTRFVGPRAARAMARLLMLQWHAEGQAPYMGFVGGKGHDDALVAQLQQWLEGHHDVENPVAEMTARCDLTRRSLERRFSRATGYSPIRYVQELRIENAKLQLENTDRPVEQISYDVGYDNVAYFRRLFRRTTRMTPGAYRRRFRVGWPAQDDPPHQDAHPGVSEPGVDEQPTGGWSTTHSRPPSRQ